jgi:hypothetical protein
MITTAKVKVHSIGEQDPKRKKQYGSRFAGIDVNGGPFPNLPFIVYGRQIELLDNVKVGDVIEVKFDIQGKFYHDKQGLVHHIPILKVVNITPVEDVISTAWNSVLNADTQQRHTSQEDSGEIAG